MREKSNNGERNPFPGQYDYNFEGATASPTAQFTSTKCPPGAGLEHTCELPFGFIWTPLAHAASSSVSSSSSHDDSNETGGTTGETTDTESSVIHCKGMGLPPIICLTCLAYMNMYAEFDPTAGIWVCPLCGAKNAVPTTDSSRSGFVSKLLSRPIVEIRQELPVLTANTDNHTTQQPLKDVINVILVLDRHLPREEAFAVGNIMQSLLLSSQQRQVYRLGLVVFDEMIRVYHLDMIATATPGMASADVFESHDQFAALFSDHHDDDGDNQTLDANIHSYLATIINNNDEPSSSATTAATTTLDCLWTCLSAIYGISSTSTEENDLQPLQSSPPSSSNTTKAVKSRMEQLRLRKQQRLLQQQQEQQQQGGQTNSDSKANSWHSPWYLRKHHHQQQQHHHHHIIKKRAMRCTGEAIHCALDLAAAATSTTNASSTTTTTARTSRIFLFTNGCPNMGQGSVVTADHNDADADATRSKTGGPDRVDPVKLLRAGQYFDLLGKSAVEEYGIGIDVLCSTSSSNSGATNGNHTTTTGAVASSELAIPVYQCLVDASAGQVITHDSFATNGDGVNGSRQDVNHRFEKNMEFIFHQCHMSSLLQLDDMFHYNDDNVEKNRPRTEIRFDGCIIDLRMASFINPTHLVGPAELMEDPGGLLPNEQLAFVGGCTQASKHGFRTNNLPSKEMLEASLSRIRLGRFDPLATLSVMLGFNDFFQRDEYAFFQFIVRYVDRTGGAIVTRIVTQRLATAGDVSEYLDSVNEEVIPVILAKEAVYRSMFGREDEDEDEVETADPVRLDNLAYDAQRDIDATVHLISGAYRLLGLERGHRGLDLTEEGGIKAAGSSVDFAFPPELADCLRRLYHLRRGPLISPGPMLSADDRAEIREHFLRLPLQDCLCMMALSLWTTGPLEPSSHGADVIPVAGQPDTLCLWDNCIIAADYHHTLFIWSGRAVLDTSYDPIRQQFAAFLKDRSSRRFPMPKMYVLAEGDSMSRRFLALLAPSHGDPIEQQIAHFPALTQLSPQQLTGLREKFQFYDTKADPSFRDWFWSVASATSSSKEEGVSLCE